MKTIFIAGRIGKSAEKRRTANGDPVTSFSVAVDDRSSKEKTTYWFDCTLWGKRGDALAQYLTKGTNVAVTGDLGMREHAGKTYLTIRVADVALQGGGGKSSPPRKGRNDGDDESDEIERQQLKYQNDLDDEIPF